MPNQIEGQPSDWRSTRFWLAIGVTGISIIAVTILAGLVIHYSKDATATAQNVLNSVLPLLGTWVGTILAYYFSKENFEAATKSVTDLAKQITPQEKLKSVLAKDKMIPRSQMLFKSLPTDKLKLGEMLSELEQAKKGNRIPVLGNKGEPMYIVHRSIIDNFLSSLALGGKTAAEIRTLTLQDLLDQNEKMKAMAQSFGVIGQDATLADAMDIMGKIHDCQDVFVTRTGAKDEPVLGWITNVIVQDNAKI
jgi:hypothetical protein